MSRLSYVSDDIPQAREFINKNKILQYVTEEEIFELVFGFKPVEYEYVVSPLRDDSNPGAWFERRTNTLRFVDYGSDHNFFPDCFDAVQQYYGLRDFSQTMRFIYKKLIEGKPLSRVASTAKQGSIGKQGSAVIDFESRNYCKYDGDFWSPYGIQKKELIQDHVFPVRRILMKNTKSGDFNRKVTYKCYAYTEFQESRKKLYMPERDLRFFSSCTAKDIGSVDHLPLYGRILIVTKSYKDARVLRNMGLNAIWLQNEGTMPDFNEFYKILARFDKVVVLFDNDKTGINVSQDLSSMINSKFTTVKSRPLWLPEQLADHKISDPADLRKIQGEHTLYKFLKSQHLL